MPIFPKYLADEADKPIHRNGLQEQAHEIMQKWVKLESEGHIFKKETAVDADFLLDVFGRALGYRSFTESPEQYELLRNFTVPDVGTADGALGNFTAQRASAPLVVIELKDADTNLDRDKFNGRTPVQQCWDYLNALPDCPWGIVSNFVTFRLYHRDKTPQAYEEFKLQDLRDIKRFREFYCLFEAGGLVRTVLGQPTRAMMLLEKTDSRQREVGEQLYEQHSENRARLIQHLRYDHDKPLASISSARPIRRPVPVGQTADAGAVGLRPRAAAYLYRQRHATARGGSRTRPARPQMERDRASRTDG